MDENKSIEFTISNLINALVKDEWEAVEGYENSITTLLSFDTEKATKIINILKDIRDEEYVHIGQLESCLSVLSDNPTENIDDGSEEGFEQLELPEDDEVEVELEGVDDLEIKLDENFDDYSSEEKTCLERLMKKYPKMVVPTVDRNTGKLIYPYGTTDGWD